MSNFDTRNPENSTLYNTTSLDPSKDDEWRIMENQLMESNRPPYNLNANGIAGMYQYDKHTLLIKRKEDRGKRQQQQFSTNASGTISNNQVNEIVSANQEAFNKRERIKDERLALAGLTELANPKRIIKGGKKGRKSRKSCKYKKSRKSKKSRKYKNK